jgi:error-prone DNA polymerase
MPAMALLDRNGVYGAQRFSMAAREHGVRPIVGAELTMEDGLVLPVLVKDRRGYENLCEMLTQAHLRSAKGECAVQWSELPEFASGIIALLGSARLERAGFGILPKQSSKSATTECRRQHATSVRSPDYNFAGSASSSTIRFNNRPAPPPSRLR